MTDDEILHRIRDIFRTALHQPTLELTRDTTADTVRGWDSLKHVELMIAVEAGFGVRFKAIELGRMKNVGDLVDKVRAKLG
jgi:acyl carrier protein